MDISKTEFFIVIPCFCVLMAMDLFDKLEVFFSKQSQSRCTSGLK